MGSNPSAVTWPDAKILYRYIWKNSARQQITVCIIALTTLPLTLAPIELQRRIIDDAVGGKNLSLLMVLVSTYAAVILLQQVVKFGYNFLSAKLAERIIKGLREKILRELPEEKTSTSENNDGAVVSMLTAEVEPIGGFGGSAFAQLVTEGGVFLSIIGYMLFTQFELAIVAICAFIPQAFATPMMQGKINEQAAERISLVREIGDDAISVKQGGNSHETAAKKRIRLIYSVRLIINKLKFSLKAVLNLFDHAADLVVLGFGGYLVIAGQTEVGVVVAFLSGLGKLRSPWRTLITYFRVVSDASLRYKLLTDKISGLK